jgi:hypothetical protein
VTVPVKPSAACQDVHLQYMAIGMADDNHSLDNGWFKEELLLVRQSPQKYCRGGARFEVDRHEER